MRVVPIAASAAVSLLITAPAGAQVRPVAAPMLNLIVPPKVIAGTAQKVGVALTDPSGKPVTATRDIQLAISAPNTELAHHTVVLPKGQSSVDVSLTAQTPGIANLKVEQLQAPETIRGAVAQLAVAPSSSYAPVPPFKVLVGVSPRVQVIARLEKAKVIARLLDRRDVGATANQDVIVSLPELSDSLDPHPIVIRAGQEYAESVWSPRDPGSFDIRPSIEPPALSGSPVSAQSLHVEAVSQIVGFRVIPDPAWAEGVRRPTINVKLGFVDAQGNWEATDRDRTVVLHSDPQNGGRLGAADLVIPRGASVAQTTFVPSQEGITTILADAGGLAVSPGKVEFRYALIYFLLVALVGGICGGSIRYLLQATSTGWQAWLRNVGVGSVCGVLAYVLAPALISIGFKPDALQSASKIFEAFLWGFVGGGTGPAVFEGLVRGLTAGRAAARPKPAGVA